MKTDILDQYAVSMNEVERFAKGFFFSADAMRFFKSRLSQDAYKVGSVYYFVTSEQGPDGIRAYTVRMMTAERTIETVGKFQEHATKARAKSAIRSILKGKCSRCNGTGVIHEPGVGMPSCPDCQPVRGK